MGPDKEVRQLGIAAGVATTTAVESALEESRRDPEGERTRNVNQPFDR